MDILFWVYKDKIIIGIDPGLRYLGIAVIHIIDNIPTIVNTLEVSTPSSMDLALRLEIIHNKVLNVCMPYLTCDVSICIEKMFININSKTSMNFAAVRGILLLLCTKFNTIDIHEIVYSSIKKTLLDKGNASKLDVAKYICDIYNIKIKSSHIIDALAAATTIMIRKRNI